MKLELEQRNIVVIDWSANQRKSIAYTHHLQKSKVKKMQRESALNQSSIFRTLLNAPTVYLFWWILFLSCHMFILLLLQPATCIFVQMGKSVIYNLSCKDVTKFNASLPIGIITKEMRVINSYLS